MILRQLRGGGTHCRGFFTLTILIMLWMIGETGSTQVVLGVAGGSAELPCQLAPPDPQDRAVLALWYKLGRRLPVYSYDARGESGTHQPNNAVLEGRGTFSTRGSPARLVLSPVLASDQGIYTCRVDYITSPTHNTLVNLTVIEPPERLSVFTDQEVEVPGATVGPISEGAPLRIYCLVVGGRPQPTVTWWSDGVKLPTKSQVMRSGDIRADLEISEISRSYQSKSFTCQAENNKQTKPLSRQLSLLMNLRPLSVKIKLPSDAMVAGVQYSFMCSSHGSKPSSVITWVLDSHEIDPARTRTHAEQGDVTTGSVSLVLQETDNGKVLRCHAQNPSIAGSTITEAVKLNVNYAPIVALALGRSLDPGEIKQGDDVYFECRVDSNPKPYKIAWYRNDEEIVQNLSSGVLVTGSSLVLQSVSRGGAGQYTCAATNTQGTHRSNAVKLNIMYPPECMVEQPAMLAVGRGERVNISCRVASNPLRATFHWKLNGSERTYSSHGGGSSLRGQLVSHYSFLGTSDKDYGSLLCWANNSIGVQQKACVFNIIPAGVVKGPPTRQTAYAGGPPSAPESCEILNNTAENIEIACIPGFDGGVQQLFIAEIFDESGSLHLNRTSDDPQFSVQTLEPGKTYVIKITSFNTKGRSPAVRLTASTLKVAEKRMGETKPFIYSPLIVIFVGILGVFVVLILLLVFVTRWRRNVSVSSGATVTRMPSPPPPSKPIPQAKPPDESPREGAMKKTTPEDEIAVQKPKKRVMVLENGRVERTGVSDPPKYSELEKESNVHSSRFGPPVLPNGSTGYYNTLGKPTYSSNFATDLMNMSPSSSAASSPTPTFPISIPSIQTPQRSYPRIALPPVNALSPLPEEYPSHYAGHHLSTLPRSREHHYGLRDDMGEGRLTGSSPYRSGGGMASVGERYHLMHEVKANPKYVVRRGGIDLDDESFV